MNIGGPERINGTTAAKTLSEVLGYDIEYAPYTPEQFGVALTSALGDAVPKSEKRAFETYISDFYHYNNTSPTKPFEVNSRYVRDRLPEVKFETLYDWALRQDWNKNTNGPSGG
jgi:hypothetical protein